MIDGTNRDGGSSGAHAKGLRSWLSKGGFVAVVMALVALAATFASLAHAQVAGGVYSGEFDGAGSDCGGGTIVLTLNDDGSAVVNITVDGATFGGVAVDDLSIDLDPVLEIADDGSFDAPYEDPLPLTVSGSFDDASVSGTIDVPDLSCAPSFSATAGEAPDEGTDEGAPAMEALPSTGTGSAGFSNDSSMAWLLAAGSLAGIGALGVGVAAMRRRGA